jgi:hypothetical protein
MNPSETFRLVSLREVLHHGDWVVETSNARLSRLRFRLLLAHLETWNSFW